MARAGQAPYIGGMNFGPVIRLPDRATLTVRGEDWRGFLQGLLTQDVETLKDGEARFAALLTPQGRILYDLFVVADGEGALLDVPVESQGGDHCERPSNVRIFFYRLSPRRRGPSQSLGATGWTPAFAGAIGGLGG